MKKNKLLKMSKWFLVFLFVFLVGGIGGVFVEEYVLVRLAANSKFENFDFIKKTNEKVTIINKIEQITIKEDDSVNEIVSRSAAAVVNIVSIDAKNENTDGPGIIMTSDGVIASYRSAINENAKSFTVFFLDGSSHEAEFLGVDEFTNLAYFKVEKNNLPTINFANSDDFGPGKKLIVIGNSYGDYKSSFSVGLLSNTNRTFNLSGMTVSSSDKMEGVFESDFSTNAGYVGSPVISYNSEMVGVMGVLEIDNRKEYFQIPSNLVKKSLERVLAGDLENAPEIGLYYLPITKEYAISNNLDRDRGALVYSPSGVQSLAVIYGSIADKADLRVGDIIISVDGIEINLDNPFSNIINSKNKGDQIELLIDRDGKEIKKIETL